MKLGFNIDHFATLRQARYRGYGRGAGQIVEPDPVFLAQCAEKAGADGITVHLREDRRHIQEADIERLDACIQTWINLEMACTDAMLEYALALKPRAVCLVPESREEVTTEGGLDVVGHLDRVARMTEALSAAGILVSLFIDPDLKQIEAAAKVKAPCVELHTGAFANHYYTPSVGEELDKLVSASNAAHAFGLIVNAGHGINYMNIQEIKGIPHLNELNIGHSIISYSLYCGVEKAVREMKFLMQG